MSLAHARSLVTKLALQQLPFAPEEDAKQLHALARWALRFAPTVAPDPPDGLLLDIHGCEHLYGGDAGLVAKLATACEQLRLTARIATAPTFAGAHALARYSPRTPVLVSADELATALAPLPVNALRIEPATSVALAEVGLTHIGALLPLPRGELATRFSPELPAALDQALGHAAETIEPVTLSHPPARTHAFDAPVTLLAAITTVTHDLLAALAAELRHRRHGVQVLQAEFKPIRGAPATITLNLTYPSHHVDHLWSLLAPKVERVNLGFGIEEIRLQAQQTSPLADTQPTFWQDDTAADQAAAFGELVDQLVTQLGPRAVMQVATVPTHVPERAFRRVKPEARPAHRFDPPAAVERPSRLLNPPEPLRVLALLPDGPPAWLQWHQAAYEIIASVGPERITPPWWEPQPLATRDYFRVQTAVGRWLWIFREPDTGQWFVHGEWA